MTTNKPLRILMVTNTYLPHVGGVARSVQTLVDECRRRGHLVLVLAPSFAGETDDDPQVVRIPAIQNFNGSDFSVRLPIPATLFPKLAEFKPEIVHSHHPFLLGDTALRIGAQYSVPVIFTHHTLYERYTHYVPGDSDALRAFAERLASGYANLCNHVIAPSESIKRLIESRGVETPVSAIPTGVDCDKFSAGDAAAGRKENDLPPKAYVVGHVGRLAPEKNLRFLASAVRQFLAKHTDAYFLIVGSGPSEAELRKLFSSERFKNRVRFTGQLLGEELVNAYCAMDVFAFASETETQGMVLAEAMAANVPVVALDAPGARELVRDKVNGRLISDPKEGLFAAALEWHYKLNSQQRQEMTAAARSTSFEFSVERCVDQVVSVYRAALDTMRAAQPIEKSAWEATLDLFETEWAIRSNQARSTGVLQRVNRGLSKIRLPERLQIFRRALSRSTWSIKLLGLKKVRASAINRGLVLIQIDGLGRQVLEKALRGGKLRFLAKLLNHENYTLHSFYAGLPSTTPAVQGELFYGVKSIVPAFEFRSAKLGKLVNMLQPETAAFVEKELQTRSDTPLLRDGSSYSNMYCGGAQESHFCAASTDWMSVLKAANPLAVLLVLLLHSMAFVRIAVLGLLEVIIAIADCIAGIADNGGVLKELKFVPARVAITVALRELVRAGVILDITRGLPVIHLNFVGYDEQSHLRGPQSNFALWTLKGIDYAIEQIWKAAQRSRHPDYDIWIYSDHGQQRAIPFFEEQGQTIEELVEKVFKTEVRPDRASSPSRASKNSLWETRLLKKKRGIRSADETACSKDGHERKTCVAASGPLGYVYWNDQAADSTLLSKAKELVDGGVPLVLFRKASGQILAVNAAGLFTFPQEAEKILQYQAAFTNELVSDLEQLMQHPDGGTFLISGWRPKGTPVTFVAEKGAHGGPGVREVHGFCLKPGGYAANPEGTYLRPATLREQALRRLGRVKTDRREMSLKALDTSSLRVMSYNIHSCLGTDGRRSIDRICEVVARFAPDLICLQEVDVGMQRSGTTDQAQEIARRLSLLHQFHPALDSEAGKYGNAILCRHEMSLEMAGLLPGFQANNEQRGALLVKIKLGNTDLHVVNSHFGLSREERNIQVDDLLSNRWLSKRIKAQPLIICGDFNARANSYVYRRLTELFRDCKNAASSGARVRTWPSTLPMLRLDYVFVNSGFKVREFRVPRESFVRRASDHLPVIVDLELAA